MLSYCYTCILQGDVLGQVFQIVIGSLLGDVIAPFFVSEEDGLLITPDISVGCRFAG